MAADLHLQIMPFDTVEQNEEILRVMNCNSLGSRFFDEDLYVHDDVIKNAKFTREEVYDLLAEQNDIWIGEVSWLKAALFEDESYIPPIVSQVSELVSNDYATLITDELIERLCAIVDDQPVNATQYSTLTDSKELREFLRRNKGKFLFSISW